MSLEILPVKRPNWTPLPFDGCKGVYAKGLLSLDHLGIAMRKFEPHATIHEHDAPMDIDVICLEGSGFTSVDDPHPFRPESAFTGPPEKCTGYGQEMGKWLH